MTDTAESDPGPVADGTGGGDAAGATDATGPTDETEPEAASGTDGATETEDATETRDASDEPAGPSGKRDVAVPLRLYKTVTVFSTLIAVVCVLTGFVLLDAATIQFSVLRRVVAGVLGALGLAPAADVLSAALAIVGLLAIGFGAGVYIVGARFRPQEMGKSQEDSGVE